MKIPRWKFWLSNLVPIPLEAAETDLNPELQLSLRKGRYCLSTPNAVYSYGDLYSNFSKSFHQLDLDSFPISEVLVLGFGMGSVPYMLEKIFKKKYSYVGVEMDEVIAHWASKYVLPELDSHVEMRIGDAAIFVETCERKFDLIVMDVFLDNVVPPQFEEIGFLENLKSLQSNDGLLLFNRLTFKHFHKKKTFEFFEEKFKSVFPAGKYLDVGHNWMLISQ